MSQELPQKRDLSQELTGLHAWHPTYDYVIVPPPLYGIDRTQEPYRLSDGYKPYTPSVWTRIKAAYQAFRWPE